MANTLAELRSPSDAFQRRLWRKLTLKLDESAAKTDPIETLMSLLNFSRSGHFVRLHTFVMWRWSFVEKTGAESNFCII